MTHPNVLDTCGLAAAALFAASALVIAGCASTRLDAQWSDPQFQGRSLRGAKVLVVCNANEPVVRRICQDKLVAQVAASGATPIMPPEDVAAGPSDKTLAAARGAGATAVFGSTIGPEAVVVGAGPTFGVGVGGVSGGGVGGGVGISFPFGGGGGQVDTGYAANVVLTDVATGQLMWTSKVTTSSWQPLETQVSELVKTAVEGAQKAGFF
ncbi:MAG TPA: hypothetical protein VJM14_16850 [Burkholderiales bacterium]|nr:hypothetical protein [Burkholderiales bacterium]